MSRLIRPAYSQTSSDVAIKHGDMTNIGIYYVNTNQSLEIINN